MRIENLPLNWFVDNLKNGQPFTFARYGDGEWLTILGFYGMRNSNGCTFSRELSEDMRAALRRQNPYHHSILRIAMRERPVQYKGQAIPYGGPQIARWLDTEGLTMPWYDGDVLLNESLKGNLFPLVEQLRERRILYVGNHRLRDLNKDFFPYVSYVEIPPTNTHLVMDVLLLDIYKKINRHKIDTICWSAGLAGKVMIDQVFMRYPELTQFDFGSMYDGYFKPMGHVSPLGSRSYIRKGQYDWQKLLRLNTKGE